MAEIPSSLDRAAAISWRVLVVAGAMALAGFLVVELRLVVLPVVVAAFLSTLLAPPARWLERRGWRPALATTAVLVAALLVLAGFASVLVPQFLAGLGPLAESVLAAVERLQEWLARGPLGISEQELERYVDTAVAQIRENARSIATGVLGGAALAVEVLAGLVLVVVVLFFFVKDGERLVAWFLGLLDEPARSRVETVARRAWGTMGAYIRGLAVIGLVDALLIGIGLVILGVPLVVPLAVLVFFGAFLPLVGAFLSGLLAALVALVSGGLVKALLVVALVVAVQQLEGHVLSPIVLGRAVNLHPLAVILALTAGAVVGGVVGAFFAVPLAAVAMVVGSELGRRHGSSPAGDRPSAEDQTADGG